MTKHTLALSLATLLAACSGPQPSDSSAAPDAEIDSIEEATQPVAHWEEGGDHGGHHGRVHHAFDDPERWAARWDTPERDAWQRPDLVVELMEIEEGMTAYDIGTGTGYFLGRLSDAVGDSGEAVGLDVESAMVEYVTQRIAAEGWENASARLVPFADPEIPTGSADRILIVNTWHHIEGRGAYAELLADALSENGTLTIVEYAHGDFPGPPPRMRMRSDDLICELNEAGFDAAVIPTDLERQYVVRATPGRTEAAPESCGN